MKKLLAVLAALFLAQATSADTLIDNVNGYTLDEDNKVVRFNAMLIGDDGRVKNLLSRGDKGPKAVDFRLDGKGRTLIPGIIDAHGHVMGLGLAALTLDLSDTNSLQEAQAKIAAYAARSEEHTSELQ